MEEGAYSLEAEYVSQTIKQFGTELKEVLKQIYRARSWSPAQHLLRYVSANEWEFYRTFSVICGATSCDNERGFSTLSRLRNNYRRRLFVHFPSLLRLNELGERVWLHLKY